jgi:endonuclease YncB( thermonuclease family)
MPGGAIVAMMRALIAALALVLACPAAAVEPRVELPGGFAPAEQVRAVEAIDGATLRLADGRSLRLVGLAVPVAGPIAGDRREDRGAQAQLAREALAALAIGDQGRGDLALAFVGPRSDRYRRVLAHAAIDGRWVQGELVAAGLAMVAIDPDQRTWVRELLALELRARAERRGLWGEGGFRVLPAAQPGRFIDGYQILEGRVASVQTIRSTTYVNFGADWRSDMTVAVPGSLRSTLRAVGIDLARLTGVTLRVRGEVRFQNGPFIEIAAPEQIERVR